MGELGLTIGGIGAVIPGNVVTLQLNPAGAGQGAAPASAPSEGTPSVVVSLSDTAWRALALDATTRDDAGRPLDDLALAALLAILMDDVRERDRAAAAISAYLLVQALR